jgi:hypothetical protein
MLMVFFIHSSGTSSNSAACYTHLNYLIQLKVDMVREIDVLHIMILFASLEFHAYVATMFMQALDYSFQQRRNE